MSVHASRSEISPLGGKSGFKEMFAEVVEVVFGIALIFLYYAVRRGRGVVYWTVSKHFMQERFSTNNENQTDWRNFAYVQHGLLPIYPVNLALYE